MSGSGGLLQIHDPLKPKGQAIGIDLGTTNSLVASITAGKPQCIAVDAQGGRLLPSVVHYRVDGAVVVGQEARALAALAPTDTIVSVKRFMGKSLKDAETRKLGAYRFVTASEGGSAAVRFEVAGGHPVTPLEVSAEILRALKRRAESHFGGKIEQAVITVPAYFDDAQRQATKDAGKLAGLEVLRLLNEPTAAALAYGLDKKSQGTFAVYDLGGGTFDVSILKLVDGIFEVKSTGGDSALGGDDFDRTLAQRLLARIPSPTLSQIQSALFAARQAKEGLTDRSEVRVTFEGHETDITRESFEAGILALVQRTGLVCRRALKDAGLTPGELQGALDGVILVGGSTRVPFVRRFVAELFGREPLADIDPDQVVALGAAIQADLLTRTDRQDEVLLLDVIPLSLGLETMGGVVEKIIPRNSTIPMGAAQVFTTFQDGQNGMDIHVLQGERELVEDCRSLARFRLSGIPPLAAGMARVEVKFQVDADGILHVSAREQSTGVQQDITVKPTHGLTDEEVEQMLMDSIDHAETDVHQRQLREQRMEARRLIQDLQKQLDENRHLLTESERSQIQSGLAALEVTSQGVDSNGIREAIQALDEQSRPFAERVMNQAMGKALTGQSVERY